MRVVVKNLSTGEEMSHNNIIDVTTDGDNVVYTDKSGSVFRYNTRDHQMREVPRSLKWIWIGIALVVIVMSIIFAVAN